MGILKTLHEKQVHNGIFVALLVIFAAGIAGWIYSHRSNQPDAVEVGGGHPLSQAATVSLCQLMPSFPGTMSCLDFEQQTNVAGHSVWSDASNIPVLQMDVISTLNLSVAEPITSRDWLEKVLPEIKASGRLDWAEPKGPWSLAAITRKNNEQELLFEDDGIVVVMQTSIFDRPTLLKYADQAAKALRKAARPATSSSGDATPKWTPAAPAKQ